MSTICRNGHKLVGCVTFWRYKYRSVDFAIRFAKVISIFAILSTDNLFRFACPDLTSKEGNWAKALAERYCVQSSVLHFYVRDSGDMYYGINGVLKGLFLSGINTMLPLWVMVDIYGNSNALEFVGMTKLCIFCINIVYFRS